MLPFTKSWVNTIRKANFRGIKAQKSWASVPCVVARSQGDGNWMPKRLVDKGAAGEGHAGSSPLSLCPSLPPPRLGQVSGPELYTGSWVYGHGLILSWDSVSWGRNYSSRWWMEASLKGKDRESSSTCPGPGHMVQSSFQGMLLGLGGWFYVITHVPLPDLSSVQRREVHNSLVLLPVALKRRW